MLLSLYNDRPSSASAAEDLDRQNLIEKLKVLDARARRKGLDSLDPSKNPLIGLGMETDANGRVTKNSYGVFNLAWQAQEHPEWPGLIAAEVAEIKKRIRQAHGVPLRFVIWAGMGGSAEDKSMYNAVGLLKRGAKVYVLDSTDPAKLKYILEDIQHRWKLEMPEVLRSTLVVAQALGMTSYEPVVNVEKIAVLYAKHKIDSTQNIVYMTLPGSLLDQFGKRGGYRKIELQLDGGNSTSGRHSSPLTRGSLYPLAFCSADLEPWIEATSLTTKAVDEAWRLAAFLHTQASAGRNKITLLLPKAWSGAAIWTKQDFEESLGKSEHFGLKIVIGERVKLANYRAPKDSIQDRCFLAVHVKPLGNGEAQKIASLRRAGYPVAVLTLQKDSLSRYMQFIHHCVFGIAYLQKMNFVTQPSVELYKAITNKLHAESVKVGGIEKTKEWSALGTSPDRVRFRSAVTLHYSKLHAGVAGDVTSAPALYASLLKSMSTTRQIEYGELTFFGDTRYNPQGRAVRKVLDRAGDLVYRSALKMPVDVYEGPAMNHSLHEMIIGHGRCFSTVIVSEKAEKFAAADYTADYHRAQFLATQMALTERGRAVVAITLKDLEPASLDALEEFFREVAAALRARPARKRRAQAAAS